jgi:hypothetical protein
MQKWLIVLAASLIGTAAFAQSTTVIKREGVTGSTVVKQHSTTVDDDDDADVVVRKRTVTTGSVGCSQKTTRKTDAFGDTTVKRKTTC